MKTILLMAVMMVMMAGNAAAELDPLVISSDLITSGDRKIRNELSSGVLQDSYVKLLARDFGKGEIKPEEALAAAECISKIFSKLISSAHPARVFYNHRGQVRMPTGLLEDAMDIYVDDLLDNDIKNNEYCSEK